MPIAAVAGDANVLLSAVIGKAALRVITDLGVEVHISQFNTNKVEEYLPMMAAKYELPQELADLQWRLLPVVFHPVAENGRALTRARREMTDRDPDDAHPLALARALDLPLWSNDRDLVGHGVDCYTTARLLGGS